MDRIIITSSYSFLKNFKLDECDLVWSLHPAVDKYCADNKFRFISILHDEPITNRKALFKYTNSLTDNTLSYLDRKYAEKISKILELPNFPIFKTIYSYRLKYTISILHLLFKKLKSVRPNSTIYFLDPSSFTLIPNNVLSKFFQEYCSSNIIHCLDLPTNFLNLIYKRIKSYRQLFIKFYKQLKFTLNSRSKKIFLLSSAYDFESMLDQFEDFPFQFIKNNSLKNNEISFTRAGSLIPLSESINNEDKLFEDLIIDLFLDEYSFIKNSILNCKKFLQTSEVDVVVWGNPPCLNSGMAVTARYLMESGIPVVGYQHGGSYGIQEMLVGHHDSDYQHCTHFFSYGFTAEDVYETTGDYPNCEIIPVGSLKVSSSVQRTKTNSLSKERIDVLYITTNQIPYLMRDSFSYQLPKSIIDLLGSQVNMKSVVKLFPGASKFNYSHYEYSKSFQNLS